MKVRPSVLAFALVCLFLTSFLVDEAFASQPEHSVPSAPGCKPGELMVSAPDGVIKINSLCMTISWPSKKLSPAKRIPTVTKSVTTRNPCRVGEVLSEDDSWDTMAVCLVLQPAKRITRKPVKQKARPGPGLNWNFEKRKVVRRYASR